MAKYGINFSGYADNAALVGDGFTRLWNTNAVTFIASEETYAEDGANVAKVTSITTQNRKAFRWDEPGNIQYGQAFFRWRFGAGAGNQQGPAIRISGTTGNENGIYTFCSQADSLLNVSLYNGGSAVNPNEPLSFEFALDEWLNTLFDYTDDENDIVDVYIWRGHPVNDQPEEPTFSFESVLTSAGGIGFQLFGTTFRPAFDFIGASDNGDPVPRSMADLAPPANEIEFSGTIPTLNGEVGTPFSVDLSGYFSGELTPFAYSLQTGSLAGSGLSLNSSTGVISGEAPVEGSYTGLVIRGTDDESNTADSNSFDIIIAEEPAPTTYNLVLDELVYDDIAKTTLTNESDVVVTVLTKANPPVVVYHATNAAIVDGVLAIVDSEFETENDEFEVLFRKGNKTRSWNATVVET